MKALPLILLFYFNAFGLAGFTYQWNVNVAKDTVTAVKLKNNYDTIKNWASRTSDSINRKLVHFKPNSLTHDSVLSYIRIDSIRSNPNIDSIGGSPYINALTTPLATIDSVKTRSINADSATIPVEKSVKTFRDSAYFASGLRALRLYTPFAKIDSIVGDLKLGGTLTLTGPVTTKGTASNSAGTSTAPLLYFSAPATTDYSIIQQGLDTLNFYTFTGGTWYKRMGISKDGNTKFTGSVTVPTVNATSGYQINGGDLLSVYDTGSFTATITGLVESGTTPVKYQIIGKMVMLNFEPYLTGTSNSVFMTITGLPSAIQPAAQRVSNPIGAIDNGIEVTCLWVSISGGTITLGKDAQTNWTASGTKGIYGGTICYMK